MKRQVPMVFPVVLLFLGDASAKDTPRPEGTPVRAPVTRDLWLSNVDKEADGNNGGAARLKLKSHQEMSLIDIEPRPLKGYVIHGAYLYLKMADSEPMRRVTVSSFAAEWVEGTASDYEMQNGSSTFNHRKHPDVPWTISGSDLCSVCLGQGGTVWGMADATSSDDNGWQRVAIDPAVIRARIAGVSHGFLIFDDTGSEWKRDGEKWTHRLYPNRFFHSRESGRTNAPYLVVYLGPKDTEAPDAPAKLQAITGDLPTGEALLSWETPADKGGASTAGFHVTANDRDVPRYLIPAARKPGERVTMHLRDLGLKAGEKVRVRIRAVDGAGNVSEPAESTVTVSDRVATPLPGKKPTFNAKPAALPKLGDIEVSVLDELDRVHARSGQLTPPQKDSYLSANHLWNAGEKRITLHSARNEFVAFQLHFRGRAHDVKADLKFEDDRILVNTGRYAPVETKDGPIPDPIPVHREAFSVPPGDSNGSLHFEVFVRHQAPAGDHKGTLTVTMGEHRLELAVVLKVWDFTLPDYLSFLPEMNAYDLDEGSERLFYRLAHRHRTVLNVVPYYQNGTVADGKAPRWNGRRFDWSAWDDRFGPYLDGSAFNDMPRKNVPLECFYLPLHENWPISIEGNYNHSYWADEAFKASYRSEFVEATRLMAIHFHDRHWDNTLFHFYLNGKNQYKEQGWSKASSPWLLDEPANFQDFWALRYFGGAFHEGVSRARSNARMLFRADISRPQWQRDSLDGLLDYNVVSGSFRQYRRMVLDRKRANGEIVIEYGGTGPVEESAMAPAAWCVDAWCLGADGVLPWQTMGTADSWKTAEDTAVFYPPREEGGTPQASLRLKAFRRGQQDVEYLTLLSQVTKQPRWAVGQRVREALKLSATREGGEGDDAGRFSYQLMPQDLWALRVQVGEYLSSQKPEPKRRLVEFSTPPRDPIKSLNK